VLPTCFELSHLRAAAAAASCTTCVNLMMSVADYQLIFDCFDLEMCKFAVVTGCGFIAVCLSNNTGDTNLVCSTACKPVGNDSLEVRHCNNIYSAGIRV